MPVVERYQGKVSRIYFLADAGFANPEVYEFLEAERIKYAIRLPANRILQESIGHLLTRPIGRPPNEVRRSYANFTYQAGSWTKPRRVVAKVEWPAVLPGASATDLCAGPEQEEQAAGAQIDAQAAQEIWLCPRQAGHR
jgi:Transposase DDE domain group 1